MLPAMQSLTLENGLQVNLLHAPQSARAAALLHLNAGSHQEPPEFAGLAHLFEHAVFAGGAQFQGHDRLMMWAQAAGAKLNATTQANASAWFFEVAPAKLEAALARLTDMLAHPLFTEDSLQQEVAVIDAEYRMLSTHADTLCDAAQTLAFSAPAQLHDFHVGCRTSFGENLSALQQALRQYHQRFVVANALTLWLQGPQPIEELTVIAERYGSAFATAHNNLPCAPIEPLALQQERYLQLRLDDTPRLRLLFPIKRCPALALLRQLLTDEIPDSLLDQLRSHALADSVRVSLPYTYAHDAVLCIEFFTCNATLAVRAGVETLFDRWLQQVGHLSTADLQHYADLALLDFSRLSPLDQLRAHALDCPPATLSDWQGVLEQLRPQNRSRLWIAPDVQAGSTLVKGFCLPLRLQAWQTHGDSIPQTPFAFYRAPTPISPQLPHTIQTTGMPMSAQQACIAQASLRAVGAQAAHEGHSLVLSYEQGCAILQISGPHAWATRMQAKALELIDAPPPAAQEQGQRLFEQKQRQLASDIAIRTLLEQLPELLSSAPSGEYEIATCGDDSAVLVFCPLAQNTAECLAATQILASFMEPQFFQQLRVEQNIGYVVSCRFHQTARQSGILFALQSPTHGANALLDLIDTFIAGVATSLEDIQPDTLEEKRCALRQSLHTPPADRLQAARQQWLKAFAYAPAPNAAVIAGVTLEPLKNYAQTLGARAWKIKSTT